jgi:hypothetical protein
MQPKQSISCSSSSSSSSIKAQCSIVSVNLTKTISDMKRTASQSFLGNTIWVGIKTWELNCKQTNVTCGLKNGQVMLGISKLKSNNNTYLIEGIFLTCNEFEGLEDLLSNYVDLPLSAARCSCGMYEDSLCPVRLKNDEFQFKDYAFMRSGYYTLKIYSSEKFGIGDNNIGHVELPNSDVTELKENIKEIYAFCRKAELEVSDNRSIADRVQCRRLDRDRALDSYAKKMQAKPKYQSGKITCWVSEDLLSTS